MLPFVIGNWKTVGDRKARKDRKVKPENKQSWLNLTVPQKRLILKLGPKFGPGSLKK